MRQLCGSPEVSNGIGFLHGPMLNRFTERRQADLTSINVKSDYTKRRKMVITEKDAREAATLAARLRLALSTRGMEAIDLAKTIKVKRQTVYYWVDGTTKSIDSDNLHKAAHALGVRAAWLQNGEFPVYETPNMGDDQIQLVGFFDKMTSERRKALMEIAESYASKSETAPTRAVPYKSKVSK